MIQVSRSLILPIIIISAILFFQASDQSIFSQQDSGSETTMSMSPSASGSEESITSYVDALIKAPLLVSQSTIVGIIFSQILFKRIFSNRILISSGRQNNIIQTDLGIAKRLFLVLTVSAVTLIASGTGLLMLQVYNLSSELGLSLYDTFSILMNTSVGTTWLLRIVTSVLILVLAPVQYILLRKRKDKIGRTSTSISTKKIINIVLYAILILGSINIISNSMVSHNAAVEFLPLLAISVDWLHMMAVSIWLGGLFYISLILLYAIRVSSNNPEYEINSNTKEKTMIVRNSFSLAIMLPYFSMIAVVSLGVIGISGLYMAWLQLQSIGSLFDSTYGNILVMKLCVIAPMIVLGAYHQTKLHYVMVQIAQRKESKQQEQFESIPNNLKQRDGKDSNISRGGRYDPFRRFSKTIKIESLIGIAVLVITSFLTITSPPSMVHSDSQMQMDMQGSGSVNSNIGGSNNNNQITSAITDAFTITAIILAIAVLIVSLYYYRKSKQGLKITVNLLQNKDG